MIKDNVFRSSSFYMSENDVLHLIFEDETGTPVTIDLVATSETNQPVEVVPGKVTIGSATDITATSFTANWLFNQNTDGYLLDLSIESDFSTFVTGYNGKDVGNVNTYSITSLDDYQTYYFRVRAYNQVGYGVDSDTITMKTLRVPKNDYFLPSKDETNYLFIELFQHGVGGLSNSIYLTSSEVNATVVWTHSFGTGFQGNGYKYTELRVRPCRAFTSSRVFALREEGPAGGLIFHIVSLGGGSYRYYEAAPTDIETLLAYSNITNTAIGATAQGTAVGTGQSNTTAIIGQVGHTNSAAKVCDDLIV